jgi:hypothetical protein
VRAPDESYAERLVDVEEAVDEDRELELALRLSFEAEQERQQKEEKILRVIQERQEELQRLRQERREQLEPILRKIRLPASRVPEIQKLLNIIEIAVSTFVVQNQPMIVDRSICEEVAQNLKTVRITKHDREEILGLFEAR